MLELLLGVAVLLGVVRVAFRDEIKACFERDPATTNSLEILLTYAGLHVLIFHRIAHLLHRMQVPLFPRVLMLLARWLTGIEIHPAARIGRRCFIDHGMGVVIGETAVIGDNVTLFQGVTLGGTGKEKGKRHPNISDHVVIGAGAKVLGNITVGEHSVIGANAVVIHDVPPHCTVVGVPGRVVRNRDATLAGEALEHTQLPDPVAERLLQLQREVSALSAQIKHSQRKQETP